MKGCEAKDGDLVVYEKCVDPHCSAIRVGTQHAHLVRVERENGEVVVNEDEK